MTSKTEAERELSRAVNKKLVAIRQRLSAMHLELDAMGKECVQLYIMAGIESAEEKEAYHLACALEEAIEVIEPQEAKDQGEG